MCLRSMMLNFGDLIVFPNAFNLRAILKYSHFVFPDVSSSLWKLKDQKQISMGLDRFCDLIPAGLRVFCLSFWHTFRRNYQCSSYSEERERERARWENTPAVGGGSGGFSAETFWLMEIAAALRLTLFCLPTRCAKICLQINYTVIRAVNQTLRSLSAAVAKNCATGVAFSSAPGERGWKRLIRGIRSYFNPSSVTKWWRSNSACPAEIFRGNRKLIAGRHGFGGKCSTRGAFVRERGAHALADARSPATFNLCHFLHPWREKVIGF